MFTHSPQDQKQHLFDLMANYGVDATLSLGQSLPSVTVLEYPSAEAELDNYKHFIENLRAELKDSWPVLVRDWFSQLLHQGTSLEEHVFSYFGGEPTEVSWFCKYVNTLWKYLKLIGSIFEASMDDENSAHGREG